MRNTCTLLQYINIGVTNYIRYHKVAPYPSFLSPLDNEIAYNHDTMHVPDMDDYYSGEPRSLEQGAGNPTPSISSVSQLN